MSRFRESFAFPNLSVANWFPGHMAKGLRKMARKLQDCDCVVEVHDARIPFSGRNPKLNDLVKRHPKILVLNKADLADDHMAKSISDCLRKDGEKEVIFTNCLAQHHKSIRELMTRIRGTIGWRLDEEGAGIRLMVVGMPNVGKSSLINALRRNYMKRGAFSNFKSYKIQSPGKGTKVGALPGVTRSVLGRILVSEHPRMYLLDTPGVMIPNIPSEEIAMKLAIIGMLRDHLIGEEAIADYLLYTLNQHQLFEYTSCYSLSEPCDDINTVLDSIAQRIGALLKGGVYDHTRAAQHFLRQFRAGKLGRITLDRLPDGQQCITHTCSSH